MNLWEQRLKYKNKRRTKDSRLQMEDWSLTFWYNGPHEVQWSSGPLPERSKIHLRKKAKREVCLVSSRSVWKLSRLCKPRSQWLYSGTVYRTKLERRIRRRNNQRPMLLTVPPSSTSYTKQPLWKDQRVVMLSRLSGHKLHCKSQRNAGWRQYASRGNCSKYSLAGRTDTWCVAYRRSKFWRNNWTRTSLQGLTQHIA